MCDDSKLNIPVCLHSSKILFWIKVAFSSFPASDLGATDKKDRLPLFKLLLPRARKVSPLPPRVTVLFLNGTRRGISYLLKNVG